MNHSITVAKIVATSLDTSWAQAYSAGKLYVVLSLEGKTEAALASVGKETLEKLQREFFALDEKTLTQIKKAVEIVSAALEDDVSLSLVLATVVENALYVVISHSGSVILKRGEEASVIATGKAGEAISLSGKVEHNDIFVLTTDGFLQTVSFKALTHALSSSNPHEIGESLAPFLHENAAGTEAALVLKVAGPAVEDVVIDKQTGAVEGNDHLSLDENEVPAEKKSFSLPSIPLSGLLFTVKGFIPKKLTKKHIIVLSVVALSIILFGSIFFENIRRQSSEQNARLETLLAPNKQKYEDALAVMSLNRSLALEELEEIKNELQKERDSFSRGSAAYKELESFLAKVNDALGGEGNSVINMFFDPSKNSELPNVRAITHKGGKFVAQGESTGGIISSDGTVEDTFEGDTPKGITADENNIYILTSTGVEKIDKGSGDKEEIIDVSGNGIDTFGGNIYLLKDKTVKRFRPTSFNEESYFTGDTKVSDPTSITIDASIYVLDSGKIKKFTRGVEDSFSTDKTFSSNSLIYTDADFANIFVLDIAKKSVAVVEKTGSVKNEFSLKGLSDISSISADETNKKMYIVANNKIYSISF